MADAPASVQFHRIQQQGELLDTSADHDATFMDSVDCSQLIVRQSLTRFHRDDLPLKFYIELTQDVSSPDDQNLVTVDEPEFCYAESLYPAKHVHIDRRETKWFFKTVLEEGMGINPETVLAIRRDCINPETGTLISLKALSDAFTTHVNHIGVIDWM